MSSATHVLAQAQSSADSGNLCGKQRAAIVALCIGMQLVVCWEQHAHVLSKSHHLLYGRKATVPSTSPPDTVQCCSQLSEC